MHTDEIQNAQNDNNLLLRKFEDEVYGKHFPWYKEQPVIKGEHVENVSVEMSLLALISLISYSVLKAKTIGLWRTNQQTYLETLGGMCYFNFLKNLMPINSLSFILTPFLIK